MRRMPRGARGACRASSRAGETAFVGPWVAKLVTDQSLVPRHARHKFLRHRV
jgi:hypothetical protein